MNIVWFRRNLRLEDNLPLAQAMKYGAKVLPIFIFDPQILANFPHPYDRRVCFIANALKAMDERLQKIGSSMHVFYGKPAEVITQLAKHLSAMGHEVKGIYADEDFEPANIERDKQVAKDTGIPIDLFCDHLLLRPGVVMNASCAPFKVFTPFSKAFIAKLLESKPVEYSVNLSPDCFFKITHAKELPLVDFSCSQQMLENIGYEYRVEDLWKADHLATGFDNFLKSKLASYKEQRDFLGAEGTSRISPYLRFGLISIRKCFLSSYDQPGSQMWVNELLWREFYANVLFHFPRIVNEEFLQAYVGTIPWKRDYELLARLEQGNTGFPIIDAAMNQLRQEGWMHNRARMIVASFASKNLLLDWRLGDKLFAKYLMDYDLASNVGGWQWSASCGTDAQPYFRIFNPFLQSIKFDSQGVYIKRYLPGLNKVSAEHIHEGSIINMYYPDLGYPKEIVDYKTSRDFAIKTFSLK